MSEGMTAMSTASGAGSTSTEAMLSVEGLAVEFMTPSGWTPVVDDVSFSVGRGETVGLVGESGSGKSVTGLAVMGLVPAPAGRISAGRIVFQGRDLVPLRPRELRRLRGDHIAMVFQEPMTSLNPSFTVGDQIAEMVRTHRRISRRAAMNHARTMLDRMGIPNSTHAVKRYPHEFSGGMRQRVMLAMAISCEPELLIADEPTTALDVTIQAQVLDLIREMRDELGMSVLFVSHDLGVVAELCDRVVVMYAAQTVEDCDADSIFTRPNHPYTEGLLTSTPRFAGARERLSTIEGRPPLPWAMPPGCHFHPRCPYAEQACAEEPIIMRATGPNTAVRCRRADELTLRGAE